MPAADRMEGRAGQSGKIVGIYDPRRNVTRTQDGKVIAQGDVLGGLLLASGKRP